MVEEHEEPKLANESVARLTVYSRMKSKRELANALSVPPDESWDIGEQTKHGRAYESSAISFRSSVPDEASPNEHLSDLLARIEHLRDDFGSAKEAGSVVRLKLAFFADTDNPMFTLNADVLRRLGDLGLDLELDIYNV